jgi:hypothetical protein
MQTSSQYPRLVTPVRLVKRLKRSKLRDQEQFLIERVERF